MNVSFGQLNVYYQKTPTRAQEKVSKKLEKALYPDWVEELDAGKNITKTVEKEKGANIDVTLKKNGTFLVSVKKDLPSIGDEQKSYTPYSRCDGKKLEMVINPNDKPSVIDKKLKTFISRCETYAWQVNSWKNEKIEQEAESKFENELAKQGDI